MALPVGFNFSRVKEYGFSGLNPAQQYTLDFIKVDRPIRETLVPAKSLALFETTSANPGVVVKLALQDDARIWESAVLSISEAASLRYNLPRRRDLSHVSALLYAARTSSVGASLHLRLIDEADNTQDLPTLSLPVADVWKPDSQAPPPGVVDLTAIKAIEWRNLNGEPFLLSPLLIEMSREGNLLIMGGDGSASGAGRFYGDGLAAVKESHETYFNQADLPEADPGAMAPPANNTQRIDLAYLDLWERPVTYIEDPELREVALEGPDTTTRKRLVAQVRLLRGQEVGLAETPQPPAAAFGSLPRCRGGTLTTKDSPDALRDPCADPCEPEVQGAFLGDANRLNRVEIYRCGDIGAEGDPGTATFTWSRENGAVASALLEGGEAGAFSVRVEKPELFSVGDLIDLSDDRVDLLTGPFEHTVDHRCHERGELRRIRSINLEDKRVSWEDAVAADPALHAALAHAYGIGYHPKIRRWDGRLSVLAGDIVLDDGIVVEFGGEAMMPGDFWVFAARTVDRSVERLIEEPPRGICHGFYKLATIERRNTAGQLSVHVEDCRPTFPPLTALEAADVRFDPGFCLTKDADWTDVGNVQEAIDALCRLDLAADLKLHNKHLHGYGVVCGLKVRCHADRTRVIIEPGYALDCEGCGIFVREADRVRPSHAGAGPRAGRPERRGLPDHRQRGRRRRRHLDRGERAGRRIPRRRP